MSSGKGMFLGCFESELVKTVAERIEFAGAA
jgi:hypothetical protein